MALELTQSRPAWVKDLPSSRLVYPNQLSNRLKYAFWRLYTPLHPAVRDALLALNIMEHTGRQNYLLGKIAPGQTIEGVVAYLVEKGYGNHFIAWRDVGELVSLRYMNDFSHQYHIRIFEDGEVRGHYEYTPECYPFLHLRAIDQQDRREEFLALLGERIVASK